MAERKITLNQIGMMLEEIRSDVKAVAEGHAVIRREMQEMKTELKEDIKEVNDKLGFVAKQLGDKLEEHVRLPVHV